LNQISDTEEHEAFLNSEPVSVSKKFGYLKPKEKDEQQVDEELRQQERERIEQI